MEMKRCHLFCMAVKRGILISENNINYMCLEAKNLFGSVKHKARNSGHYITKNILIYAGCLGGCERLNS